jgi:hypothetical protein
VRRELARIGGGCEQTSLVTLVDCWPEAVGAAIAANAWPARVARDGTLVVHTSSSVWAQELTQLAETIRERLGDEAPEKLRFLPGPLPERGPEVETTVQQLVHEPTAEERSSAQELAAEIAEPSLREAVLRAASLSLAAAAARSGATGPSGKLSGT